MLKKILLIALLAAPIATWAQTTEVNTYETAATLAAQPRFGYLSYNTVYRAMPEYASAQESMNEIRAKYEAEMKRADEEFNRKYAEFLQEQSELTEPIRVRRQKELQLLMERSLEFKEEIKGLLKKANEELTATVYTRLNEALKATGEAHNFEFILNTDGNACPYINTQSGMDITSEVKARLGIKE